MIKVLMTAVALASTVAAHAETFTFTGNSQITNQVAGPGMKGQMVGASFSTNENQASFASGKKTTSKGTCAVWSAPPGSQFSSNGVCALDDGTGKFSVTFSCQSMDDKNTIADCWGRLMGVSGSYLNKTGTASWRGQNPEGKGGPASGSGSWN